MQHYSILTVVERYGSDVLNQVYNDHIWKTKDGKIRYANGYWTRQKILFRDKYTCQTCGSRLPVNKLVVHHIKYSEPPDSKDLITLCNSCHGKVRSGRLKLNV